MELNEREAHCVARLLQGAFFGEEITDGCDYCKFQCGIKFPVREAIKKRLTEETGVDLSNGTWVMLPHSNFPYNKFLKNANETSKEVYRNHLNYLLDFCKKKIPCQNLAGINFFFGL